MRVRDELKMTISAYQTLYQSSVTFGMQKLLQSEKGKTELEQRIAALEKKKAELDDKVKTWTCLKSFKSYFIRKFS